MDNLLRINYESEQPTVSARDLYEKLNIKTAFKDWFPRMCEYGFDEGKDFCSKMSETSSKGGRPSKDADISIDNMTWPYDSDLDIVKVFKPALGSFNDMLSNERNRIWDREEVRKMTVSEICKELGYEVEIVRDDS